MQVLKNYRSECLVLASAVGVCLFSEMQIVSNFVFRRFRNIFKLFIWLAIEEMLKCKIGKSCDLF